MNLLTLDQATKTGYSLWKDKELIKYGLFNTTDIKDIHMEEKISNIKMFLDRMIQEYQVDIVVLEDIQQQKNVDTFKKLAYLLGVLQNYLFEKGTPYIIIKPSQWKPLAGVKGRTREPQKKSAMEIVKKKYGIEATEDECDAICIGYAVTKRGTNKFEIIKEI